MSITDIVKTIVEVSGKNLDIKSMPSLLFVNGEKKKKIEPNYLDAEVMLNKIELFKLMCGTSLNLNLLIKQ